jgi:hypothetical protein
VSASHFTTLLPGNKLTVALINRGLTGGVGEENDSCTCWGLNSDLSAHRQSFWFLYYIHRSILVVLSTLKTLIENIFFPIIFELHCRSVELTHLSFFRIHSCEI